VIVVAPVSSVDDALYDAVAALVPQLSRSSPPPSRDVLDRIVAGPGTTLFVATADERIVGMLTLATFQIPTKMHAIIEDVVVDEGARGSGAGGALVEAALAHARSLGVPSVDLTSRPHREAANRLYLRMGFAARTTNVYRYTFEG
jgi:ribosomal protein S18 acetylase RimI-like enzyme